MTARRFCRVRPGVFAVILVAFVAGWTTAATQFATSINSGLVQAFNSVGQNLFGAAVFSAVTVPPNPTLPQGAVQLDFAIDSQIPTQIGVFSPLDPCRRFAQLEVQGDTLTIAVDYEALPEGFTGEIVAKPLAAPPPAVNRCISSPTVDVGQ